MSRVPSNFDEIGLDVFARHGLPEGFQACKWIQSVMSMHIKTGVFPSPKTRLKIKATPTGNSYGNLISTMVNNKFPSTKLQVIFANGSHSGFWYGSSFQSFAGSCTVTDAENVFQVDGKYFAEINQKTTPFLFYFDMSFSKNEVIIYVNGEKYWEKTVTAQQPKTINNPNEISIFSRADNDGFQTCLCKLYSLEIYDGTKRIRDFVPCLDDTGVACLFDRMSGKVFYSTINREKFKYELC